VEFVYHTHPIHPLKTNSRMINGHFWIENEEGVVIYDPQFPDYRVLADLHKCDLTKPQYRKASAERQRELITTQIFPQMLTINRGLKEGFVPDEEFWTPQSHNCASNCLRYKCRGGEGKIVYGDFGWERKNGSGVFWEFEDCLCDAAHAAEMRRTILAMTKKERKEMKRKYLKAVRKREITHNKYSEQMGQLYNYLEAAGIPPSAIGVRR